MHTPSPDQLNIITQVANTVEMKAARARKTATSNYVLTMIIGLGILSLFLFAGPLTEAIRIEQLQKAVSESAERAKTQLVTLQQDTNDLVKEYTVIFGQLKSEKLRINKPEVATVPNASKGSQSSHIESQSSHIESQSPKIQDNPISITSDSSKAPSNKGSAEPSTVTNKTDTTSWWDNLLNSIQGDTIATFANSIIARIGAVLIAIFLIQILLSFARYNYRLSEHLSACADMIRLSAGDTDKMRNLAPFMLPSIEFGKIPSSPFQKIVDTSMDTIKELAKKVPTR